MMFILRRLVGKTKHDVQNSFDFVKMIKGITLKPEETIISYDVVGLFTKMPPTSAIDVVHQALHLPLVELICLVIRLVTYCICAWIAHFSLTMFSFIINVMAVRWVLQF